MTTSDYIMIAIVSIFLLAAIVGCIAYESMTPEEKKKFEEEQQLRKYKRWTNRNHFWNELLKDAKGPCDV
ncbi:MAG: hypothetical protein IJ692_04220 [Alloprevotella sp.]|nr:hypothetical protein [Alloprevotella sp.]